MRVRAMGDGSSVRVRVRVRVRSYWIKEQIGIKGVVKRPVHCVRIRVKGEKVRVRVKG